MELQHEHRHPPTPSLPPLVQVNSASLSDWNRKMSPSPNRQHLRYAVTDDCSKDLRIDSLYHNIIFDLSREHALCWKKTNEHQTVLRLYLLVSAKFSLTGALGQDETIVVVLWRALKTPPSEFVPTAIDWDQTSVGKLNFGVIGPPLFM